MLSAKQIAAIITAEMNQHPSQATPDNIETAAQKIHDLCKPDHDLHVAAAALENEVTSTLLDMLAATILATLIEQEGGGRTNVQFSPLSMRDAMKAWDYTVEHEGIVRTVRIKAKADGEWNESLINEPLELRTSRAISHAEIGPEDMPPPPTINTVVEPHEHKRPEWVVAYQGEQDEGDRNFVFLRSHDRADAERQVRKLAAELMARVENRWCLHTDCPASGCNHSPELRDDYQPEATSDD